MIYKFRVILDAEEDVFRDIEIEASDSLEDLHNAIIQAFGFDGAEVASFYLSDKDWNQGEEIPLFDVNENQIETRFMGETFLDELLDENNRNLIYVYDFFNMWTFFVELADIAEPESGVTYPNLLFAHGHLPDTPPNRDFDEAGFESFDDTDEDFDVDDYDNFDFDENWN